VLVEYTSDFVNVSYKGLLYKAVYIFAFTKSYIIMLNCYNKVKACYEV